MPFRRIAWLAAAFALLPLAGRARALLYPAVLKTAPNLLAGRRWHAPSGPNVASGMSKGGPFSPDETVWSVECRAPVAAYWSTRQKVAPGSSYLVGAWVRFANARVLFWMNGVKAATGERHLQRLFCLGGYNSYLSPYMSDELRSRLRGSPDEWKLCFRQIDFPDQLKGGCFTLAIGNYCATGSFEFAAPFLIDITDGGDRSLAVDIADARPVRSLAVERVGQNDTVWRKDFPDPVTAFAATLEGVTDYTRGFSAPNRIDGHALRIVYADGTEAKVFAPQENVLRSL